MLRTSTFEDLESRTLLAVSSNSDGWTVVDPSADTRTVYVSSSQGNDSNDGLTPQTAKRSIAAGKSLIRDGSPDWLLLKRGDIWVDQGLGSWSTSGRSSQEPQLVSTYGDGDRPLLKTSGHGLQSNGAGTTSNVFFMGIHFHQYKNDYDSPEFTPGSGGYSGVDWVRGGENIVFEDLYVEGFTMGIVIQNRHANTDTKNVTLFRSIIVDNYTSGSFSHGLFLYNLSNVTLSQNVLDHNGWASSRDASATILNHNIYVQNVGNDNYNVSGNIISRASATGIQLRPGGNLSNNLFVENPITAIVGYPGDDPWSTYPNGVDSVISNNVILNGNDTNSTTPRGTAIQLADVKSNTTSGNIIAHDSSVLTNTYGIRISGTSDDPSRNINLRDNIFYEWYRGGPNGQGSPDVTISSEENNFYSEHSPISGSNQDSATVNWFDPNRTAGSYNLTLGGPPSFDAFIAEARKQSRTNWRPEYTADAVNNYVRAGFSTSGGGGNNDNRAPSALPDTTSVTEDSAQNPVSGNALNNDSDPDNDDLTVVRVEGAAGNVGQNVAGNYGTFRLNANGSYSYTLNNSNPTVDALNSGETLTDTFDYTISDSELSASSTVRITIRGAGNDNNNAPPIAFPDANSVREDRNPNPVSGNVLNNDTDADNDTLTVVNVRGQAANVGTNVTGNYGTLRINANGGYTYTLDNSNSTVNALDNGETLTDSFSYTASDGRANNSTSLVVTINGTTDNGAPVAVNDSRSINEDGTNPVSGNVLSNDTDPNNDELTVTRVEGSAGNVGSTINGTYGTIRINSTGTYQYTLNNSNPTVNGLNGGQTLTESFDYTVSDGSAADTGRLTVTINGRTDVVNSPPIAVGDNRSITEDGTNPVSGNVLTNDTDADNDTLTVVNVRGQASNVGTNVAGDYGTLRLNANGNYTYTLNNSNAAVNALNNGQTLTDSFSYTASDGQGTNSTSLVVTIRGTTDNRAPVAVNDSRSITEDGTNPVSGNVITNDTDADGDSLNVSRVAGVAGNVGSTINGTYGTIRINSTGTYQYTLNNANSTVNALNTGQTLTERFDYTVSDGSASDVGRLTITINGRTDNRAPVAVNDSRSVTENGTNPVTGNVLTNDTDADGNSLTVSRVEGVAGNVGSSVNGTYGTIRINSTGTYLYTLNNSNSAVNALNTGQTLSESFDYTVSDGTAADVGRLTVTINGITDNRAPVAVNDSRSITEDGAIPVSGNVLSNDTDADGNSLSVSRVEGVAGSVGSTINGTYGSIRINSNGTYQYTLNNSNAAVNALNNGQTLTEAFDYTASDGSASDNGRLTITINGRTDAVNRPPVAVNDTRSITEDGTNPVSGNVLTNDTDADGDALVVSRVEGTAASVGSTVSGTYGTIRINSNGTFQYTLNNSNAAVNALNTGQTLTESFGYTVSDGTAANGGRLTITINGRTDVVNRPPVAVNDSRSITEDGTNPVSGNVLTNDTDADGDTLAVSRVEGALGNVGSTINGTYGTIRINANGTYRYTLNNQNQAVNALSTGQTLTETFDYTASDGRASNNGRLTVTINGSTDNRPPVVVADRGTITEDSSTNPISGNVLTNDSDPDGDALTVVRVNGSAAGIGQSVTGNFGTLVLRSNGTYQYTLDNSNVVVNALNNGATIAGTFGYTVSDSESVTSSTLAIDIRGNTDATPAVPGTDFIARSGSKLIAGVSTGSSFEQKDAGIWSGKEQWQDLGTGDVNDDGVDDIVGRASNGDWWVGLGKETGFENAKWGSWSGRADWEDVKLADVTGDGRTDIVGRVGGVWWVARSTGSRFVNEQWGEWSSKVDWQYVMAADVNGDGRADIVGRMVQNGTWWAAISTGSTFNNQYMGRWAKRLQWTTVRMADVNGDGRADLLGRTGGTWWVGRSTGSEFVQEKWGNWTTRAEWQDVRIGDVDGDGKMDIIGRSGGAWWVARSNGSRFVNEKWGDWSTAVDWLHIRVADFNGDGKDDILGYANGNWWVSRSDSDRFVNELWGNWSEKLSDVLTGDF